MREADSYPALHSNFRWQVPADFNIGEACCGRWARETPDAIAVRHEREDGTRRTCSYRQLQARSRRLAAALQRLGVRRGDRVAIVMAQRIETAVAHIALHQLGAVAMPLSVLFGPEALEFRLQDSEACIAIGDEASIAALRAVRAQCPSLASLVVVGAAASGPGEVGWDTLLQQDEAGFVPV